MNNITIDDIKNNKEVETYIRMGNMNLRVIGFTEHSFRHANLVSKISSVILTKLNYTKREIELAGIAGYLHDIGNVISRQNHGQSGAFISWNILKELGMPPDEIALICSAIGNHEEQYGHAINSVSAALILADKSDVHRSRVRNNDVASFDIHDRVNYAVEQSFVKVDDKKKVINLDLTINTNICPVMEYFEIFLTRMMMCRRAAAFLDSTFELTINQVRLL